LIRVPPKGWDSIESSPSTRLSRWPDGTVATSAWLNTLGISRQLVRGYVQGGWITPLGVGAFKKLKDTIEWHGALQSLQQQRSLSLHAGGPTAIALQGASHYLRMGAGPIVLFSYPKTLLPKWFTDYEWGQPLHHINTAAFPHNIGVENHEYKGLTIKISSLERAILECLYLSPQDFDLLECYQILEGLLGLRPDIVQALLSQCHSVKVKRLFLYMAEKAQLPVLKHLDLENIDLGTGHRLIVKNGLYNSEYNISLPEELVNYG